MSKCLQDTITDCLACMFPKKLKLLCKLIYLSLLFHKFFHQLFQFICWHFNYFAIRFRYSLSSISSVSISLSVLRLQLKRLLILIFRFHRLMMLSLEFYLTMLSFQFQYMFCKRALMLDPIFADSLSLQIAISLSIGLLEWSQLYFMYRLFSFSHVLFLLG